jgi:hypothetical protein
MVGSAYTIYAVLFLNVCLQHGISDSDFGIMVNQNLLGLVFLMYLFFFDLRLIL